MTFKLDDFSAQVLGMKSTTISETPLDKVVEHLVYIAYDEDGIEVSRIRQNSSGFTTSYRPDEDGNSNEVNLGKLTFGSFTDSLAAGDYTIVLVASQKEFGISSYNEAASQPFDPLSQAYFIYEYRFLENRSRTKDTFYKKFQLKVEDKDLQKQIVLERIVGKAEINILDAEGRSYRFNFINEREGMHFLDDRLMGGTEDEAYFGASEVIQENSKFTAYILNTDPDRPIDIVIEGLHNGVNVRKTIEKVPFYKNKRTILTGYMNPPGSSAGFNVTVNDEFDKDSINVGF